MPAASLARVRASVFARQKGVLDTLTTQPVVAHSMGRVLRMGRATMTRGVSSLAVIYDQVRDNHLTPVGVVPANDNVNGLPYVLTDGASAAYFAMASGITLGVTFEVHACLGVTKASSTSTVIGREGFAGGYIRQSTTQALIRNAAGTTATVTGGWPLKGFHHIRYVCDGVNFLVYVDGELWGSVVFANTSPGMGVIDRVLRGQTSNYFGGGFGEIIIFDQVLSAADAAALTSSCEAAWRTPLYFAGDGVGSNSNFGWSADRALQNFDMLNATLVGGVPQLMPMRPGFQGKLRRGATFRRSPLYITDAGQTGSAAKHNSFSMYDADANGPARIIHSTQVTGPWTLVSGTKYSAPCTAVGSDRVDWVKAGYGPQEVVTACEVAWDAAGPGQFVDFAAVTAMREQLVYAASSGAVGAKGAFCDGTTLYVDIGMDPTGQAFEVASATSGGVTLPTNRCMQTSRPYWDFNVWLALEGAAEDCLAFSGSNCRIAGESKTRRLIAIAGSGDCVGGKGGVSNVGQYITGVMPGSGRVLTGSRGDVFSWHGNSAADLYDCDAFLGGKAGLGGQEQGTTVRMYRCRAAGCNQNFQVLNQGGGAGQFAFIDCEGKFAANDNKAMFQFFSNTAGQVTFSGGHYYGVAGAIENTFVHVIAGCAMTITGQANRSGFTTDVFNESGSATVSIAA